ncbi:hypothetical protein GCM10027614_50900 [Micromonospora vulcania]
MVEARPGEGADRIAGRLAARPLALRPAARGGFALAECRRPADEVARRLGHGVAVLLRVHANSTDGGDTMNDKIGDALG